MSHDRKELEKILRAFNIYVDNPCCVLTQEESKKFIQGQEREKYDFFLKVNSSRFYGLNTPLTSFFRSSALVRLFLNHIFDFSVFYFLFIFFRPQDLKGQRRNSPNLNN